MVRALPGLLCMTMVGIAVASALVVAPAAACGCGAYIPGEGEARVVEEREVIRWDGSTENIVMEPGVEGRSGVVTSVGAAPYHGQKGGHLRGIGQRTNIGVAWRMCETTTYDTCVSPLPQAPQRV